MTVLADLVEDVARRLEAGEAVSDRGLQELLLAAVRSYARRVTDDAVPLAPVPADVELTATEALLVAGGLLRAAEVSSFELAMMFNL